MDETLDEKEVHADRRNRYEKMIGRDEALDAKKFMEHRRNTTPASPAGRREKQATENMRPYVRSSGSFSTQLTA